MVYLSPFYKGGFCATAGLRPWDAKRARQAQAAHFLMQMEEIWNNPLPRGLIPAMMEKHSAQSGEPSGGTLRRTLWGYDALRFSAVVCKPGAEL